MAKSRSLSRFASVLVVGLTFLPVHSQAAEKTPEDVCRQLSHVDWNECMAAALLLMRGEIDAQIDLRIRVEASDGRLTYSYEDVSPEDTGTGRRDCMANDILVLPAGKTVSLLMTSVDVVYTWRVPALSVASDLVPGRVNEAIIAPVEKPVTMEGRLSNEGAESGAVTRLKIVADAYEASGKLKSGIFCKG